MHKIIALKCENRTKLPNRIYFLQTATINNIQQINYKQNRILVLNYWFNC